MNTRAVTADEHAAESGVPLAPELLAFADATVKGTDAELATARSKLLSAAGPEALVDTAAIVGNFQRMVRIADGTGIPLDGPVHLLSVDLREDLGLNAFASADHSPKLGPIRRTLGRALQPLLRLFVRSFIPKEAR